MDDNADHPAASAATRNSGGDMTFTTAFAGLISVLGLLILRTRSARHDQPR